MENIRIFYLKKFQFLVVKFSVCLNRHVFVMPAKHTFKIKTQILLIVYIVMNRVPPWSPIIYSENRYIVGYDISFFFFFFFRTLQF